MKKFTREIRLSTLKTLLARSGNQCAFLNCTHPLFNEDNQFIAQLCHIEGVLPLSPRHNANKTDKDTNSYDNLLFLCYRHHIETNNLKRFPVARLQQIKAAHEEKFREASYRYSKEALQELINETNYFWLRIKELQKKHVIPELKVPINTSNDSLALIKQINHYLKALNGLIDEITPTVMETHFEYICLGVPNCITRISVAVQQLEIKQLEELIMKNPEAENLKKRLNTLRKKFEFIAQNAGLAD